VLVNLLENMRFEVIPGKGIEQAVLDWIPAGQTVAVTASPVRGLEPTVDPPLLAARRLQPLALPRPRPRRARFAGSRRGGPAPVHVQPAPAVRQVARRKDHQ
jgi:hypothetical protein